MSHWVKVYQLCSESDKVCLNVDEDTNGHISVEGSLWQKPTYLLQGGISFKLICFDGQEWADEWLEEHSEYWDKITKLEEG